MKILAKSMFIGCSVFACAQVTDNLTDNEISFVRYLLLSVSSQDRDAAVAKMNLDGITMLYGLDPEESKRLEIAGNFLSQQIQRLREAPLTASRSAEFEGINRTVSTQFLNEIRVDRSKHFRLQASLLESVGRQENRK